MVTAANPVAGMIIGGGMAKIARTDEEIARCFDVITELRPHLQREAFVPLIRDMQAQGYELAFIEEAGHVVSVAGYRIYTNLWLGRHLYVEDLVTAADARSGGHGQALLEWLKDRARSAGCGFIDLDSGTHRGRAHKFYFQHGFTILGYHFGEAL